MHRRRLPKGSPGVREYLKFSAAELEAGAELVADVAEKMWEDVYDHAVLALHPPKPKK